MRRFPRRASDRSATRDLVGQRARDVSRVSVQVLRAARAALEEEPDDEEVMDPRRQGAVRARCVRAVLHGRGRRPGIGAITPDNLDDARDGCSRRVVDRALERLPPAEAASNARACWVRPAAAGLGEAVLRMEAERPVAVVERLLEHRLDGDVQHSRPTRRAARSSPLAARPIASICSRTARSG